MKRSFVEDTRLNGGGGPSTFRAVVPFAVFAADHTARDRRSMPPGRDKILQTVDFLLTRPSLPPDNLRVAARFEIACFFTTGRYGARRIHHQISLQGEFFYESS